MHHGSLPEVLIIWHAACYPAGNGQFRRFAAPERQFVVAKAPSGQQSALSGQLKIVFLSAYALRVRIRNSKQRDGISCIFFLKLMADG